MRQHGSKMAQHSPNMASNLGPKKCLNYAEVAPYVALGAKLAQHGSKDPPNGLEDPQVGAKLGPKTPKLEPKWDQNRFKDGPGSEIGSRIDFG